MSGKFFLFLQGGFLMKGNAMPLRGFVDGSSVQLKIPVYQRNYSWLKDNCEQLFNDVLKLHASNNASYFLGSIVSGNYDGSFNRIIIDGQQRLTTISLLIMAAIKAVKDQKLSISNEYRLSEALDVFLTARYCASERKLKLIPIKKDLVVYDQIFELINSETASLDELDNSSHCAENFLYFYERLVDAGAQGFTFDFLLDAISRFQIISIELEPHDDAQLIFESLNSTGLALSEADKVRNYILMALLPDEQSKYFEQYWVKIEEAVRYDTSKFLRCYLSLRANTSRLINQDKIYVLWKKYMEGHDRKEEIKTMLYFASLYQQVNEGKFAKYRLASKMRHLCGIHNDSAYLFFMQFLHYANEQHLAEDEIWQVFDVIENYLARRIMCNAPSNALSTIFCALHKDVLRSMEEYERAHETLNSSYVDILTYHILRREGSAALPNDESFIEGIKTREFYKLNRTYRAFLLERLENALPGEENDVVYELNNQLASIEHIMPQKLTPQWKAMLGADYQKVHKKYLNCLANLTLTGINSELSNRPFEEKVNGFTKDKGKDKGVVVHGYKHSKYRLTRSICLKTQWTAVELEERAQQLIETLLGLYPYPQSSFVPLSVPDSEVSLEDEDFDPTSRTLIAYRLFGIEHQESNWTAMFLTVIKSIWQSHEDLMEPLFGQSMYFRNQDTFDPKYCKPLVEGKYIHTLLDNKTKLSVLRNLFDNCHINKNELELVLQPKTEQ